MLTSRFLPSTRRWLPLAIAVLISAIPLGAAAATAGELLEKAIYTEETVGDLDKAITLYEQVIAEGKAARGAAAQAQYRLGLCFQKQGNPEKAAAAFQAVIDDFPQERDLVAQARKRLPSELELVPAPWGEGDVMQLNLKLGTGLDVGVMFYAIEAGQEEGKEVWRCSTRGLVTVNGASSYSRVLCDKGSFAPMYSLWKHSLLGEAEAFYEENTVKIKIAGKKPNTRKVTPPVFDNEQCAELFRRLPLEVGYKTTIRVVSSLGAGEIPITCSVSEKETIEVPVGTFECYKLELNIGQTFWISADEQRYIVRFAAGNVTADLAEVGQPRVEPCEFTDGPVNLTLPAGWHAYAPGEAPGKDFRKIYLLDPKAVANVDVALGPRASLKEAEQTSPRAWTQGFLNGFKTQVKDVSVREPGVHDLAVGDRTASAVIVDYTSDGKPMTLYGVAVFGETTAANLTLTVAADKFDECRKEFDAIAGSLRVE